MCYCNKCKIIGGIPFDPFKEYDTSQLRNGPEFRAGVIVCNQEKDRVLLVQSLGYKWGFAKGCVEHGETVYEAATRELLEETGLYVPYFDHRYIRVFNRAIYYIHELDSPGIDALPTGNEITGIMWIKLSCLEKLMLKDNPPKLNAHCKFILGKYFRISRG